MSKIKMLDLQKAKALLTEFTAVNAATHASSIAYFTFLSLIPLITLSISLVTMTGLGQREVAEFFSATIPGTFNDFTKTLVDDAFKQSGIAFSLSVITLLWTASQGIRALHSGLNAAYCEKEERGPVVVAAISIGMVIALGALLAAAIYLVFGGVVTRAVESVIPGLEQQKDFMDIMNSAVLLTLSVIVLTACYTFLPFGQRRFVSQLPGAAIASLACGALTAGFRVYVDNFCNFEALYGSISTIALFLFWMYIVAFILIACAFFNRALHSR
ncbi:MAG: YihY/virulence factor BrkB family protein [Eggerthellaceae bacterium]|nr:YihY/virulence factor BrkB family protein [Eggerthellaceae bacterium]